MAKMKVFELAKELEIQSKDVITYLREKGMDVKAAQSSIEEEAIALVREQFKKADKGQEKVLETEKPAVSEKETVKAEKTVPVEKKEVPAGKEEKPAAAEKRPVGEGTKTEEPPKKKKKIIIINNSGNSKMQGNRNGERNSDRNPDRNGRDRDRRPEKQGQGRPQGNGARTVSAANPYRPLIKMSIFSAISTISILSKPIRGR